MKRNAYFTLRNIEAKSRFILDRIRREIRVKEIPFEPRLAALLVLDMQLYFSSTGSHAFIPSFPAILPRISALAASAEAAGMTVLFSRHANNEENAGSMRRWWRELLSPHHPLGGFVSPFNPEAGMVVEKSQYDAFLFTDLHDRLADAGIRQVVICGVMTHLCCESTARTAFMRGYDVFFPVDTTATYNETLHIGSMLSLAHGFAVPVHSGQLIRKLEESVV